MISSIGGLSQTEAELGAAAVASCGHFAAVQLQSAGVQNGIGNPSNCSKKPAPIGAGF
jgi:hypothetical protein